MKVVPALNLITPDPAVAPDANASCIGATIVEPSLLIALSEPSTTFVVATDVLVSSMTSKCATLDTVNVGLALIGTG